jgi:hypothetical protein
MITEAKSAVPNPSILKESPITLCVIISVMALITNKNRPSVRNVTGRVSKIKIGLTNTFKIDRIKLAIIAALTDSK